MKRLFFALWPDESARQQCRKITRAVHGYGRSVSPNNLHVTLGSVDQAKEEAMIAAADKVVVEPMTLTFNQLHLWKRPGVVCLGTGHSDPALSDLVSELTSAAVQNEISVDSRPYKPHVTLLRKAKSLPEIRFKPLVWRIDDFCLVESCSTRNGVEYKVIQRWACQSTPVSDQTDSSL